MARVRSAGFQAPGTDHDPKPFRTLNTNPCGERGLRIEPSLCIKACYSECVDAGPQFQRDHKNTVDGKPRINIEKKTPKESMP